MPTHTFCNDEKFANLVRTPINSDFRKRLRRSGVHLIDVIDVPYLWLIGSLQAAYAIVSRWPSCGVMVPRRWKPSGGIGSPGPDEGLEGGKRHETISSFSLTQGLGGLTKAKKCTLCCPQYVWRSLANCPCMYVCELPYSVCWLITDTVPSVVTLGAYDGTERYYRRTTRTASKLAQRGFVWLC